VTAPVAIDFRKIGHGWADLEFRVGEKRFVTSGVSHTTDVLGDLLRSAIAIATGSDRATIHFDREPAEWRIQMTSMLDIATGLGPMQLRILELESFSGKSPDSAGHEVFIASCGALEFGSAILKMANDTADHYERLGWDKPFPLAAVYALEGALRTYKSGYGTL
jgi:hypothetical protein